MSVDVENLLEELLKDKNTYLIPPTLDSSVASKLISFWQQTNLSRHGFITSSGTTSNSIKSYALSYEALSANAQAVNDLIGATYKDKWLSSLPVYHVGGLSIYVRSKLSGSKVIRFDQRWNYEDFFNILQREQIQFCSLVPTQLYDLVTNNIKAPKYLKAVFIGGDFLPDVVKNKAIQLQWPLYLTFGMTEVCSQLATSFHKEMDQNNGFLKILPPHNVKTLENRLIVKSPSLFTQSYLFDGKEFRSINSEYSEGYFVTNDLVELSSDKKYLKPIGRFGNEIKIKGRLINIVKLKNILAQECQRLSIFNQVEIVITPDHRQGRQLELWLEHSVKQFEKRLMELIKINTDNLLKVSQVRYFDKLPRTKLGKLKLNID